MTKDYLKKEPSKQEKYIEYRMQAIEHDLINLQRQVSTVARIMKIQPDDFIKGLNDAEGYKTFIEDLNKAYEKFRAANPGTTPDSEQTIESTAAGRGGADTDTQPSA